MSDTIDIVQVSHAIPDERAIHVTIKFNIPRDWLEDAGAEHMIRELAGDEASHMLQSLRGMELD